MIYVVDESFVTHNYKPTSTCKEQTIMVTSEMPPQSCSNIYKKTWLLDLFIGQSVPLEEVEQTEEYWETVTPFIDVIRNSVIKSVDSFMMHILYEKTLKNARHSIMDKIIEYGDLKNYVLLGKFL